MKITKKQLRRIIKEAGGFRDYDEDEIEYTSRAGTVGETHPEYQGLPQSDIDYYELADDYALWVEDFGQGVESPNRPDVMASYFLEKGLEDDHAKHEMLGKAFQVSHADIMKELELQAADQKAAEEILSTRIGNYSSSPYAKKTNEGYLDDVGGDKGAHVVDYLRAQARSYHNAGRDLDVDGDGIPDADAIKVLLYDDFDDNFGHEFDVRDFDYEISNFAHGADLHENKGPSLNQMPDSWRQILGNCLGDN
jgi:hypothetical protein